jgi:hypothetical protein
MNLIITLLTALLAAAIVWLIFSFLQPAYGRLAATIAFVLVVLVRLGVL